MTVSSVSRKTTMKTGTANTSVVMMMAAWETRAGISGYEETDGQGPGGYERELRGEREAVRPTPSYSLVREKKKTKTNHQIRSGRGRARSQGGPIRLIAQVWWKAQGPGLSENLIKGGSDNRYVKQCGGRGGGGDQCWTTETTRQRRLAPITDPTGRRSSREITLRMSDQKGEGNRRELRGWHRGWELESRVELSLDTARETRESWRARAAGNHAPGSALGELRTRKRETGTLYRTLVAIRGSDWSQQLPSTRDGAPLRLFSLFHVQGLPHAYSEEGGG